MKHLRDTLNAQEEEPQHQEELAAKVPKEVTTNNNNNDNLNIEPMRPLLRGYCSTLTLPGRPQRNGYGRMDADYCEINLTNG